MQPKGGRARLRARPPFRYAFYSQNPQKCLRGGVFEGFRGPREGFLRVFQNFRGRQKVFWGFFEGFLLALKKLSKIVWNSSFFEFCRPRKFWKTLKKPSRCPLKPSKNPPWRHFYEFWPLNASAPPLSLHILEPKPSKMSPGRVFWGF